MDKTSVTFKIQAIKSIAIHVKSYKEMRQRALARESEYPGVVSPSYLQTSIEYGEQTLVQLRKELVDNFDNHSVSDQVLILKFLFGIPDVAK